MTSSLRGYSANTVVGTVVPIPIKADLVDLAIANHRTLSSEIREALLEHIRRAQTAQGEPERPH